MKTCIFSILFLFNCQEELHGFLLVYGVDESFGYLLTSLNSHPQPISCLSNVTWFIASQSKEYASVSLLSSLGRSRFMRFVL